MQRIRPSIITEELQEVLREVGYYEPGFMGGQTIETPHLNRMATGGFGKWGCGGRDSTGVPEKHGFDVFFGYYDQVHAHTYYPPYLIRNSEEVRLAALAEEAHVPAVEGSFSTTVRHERDRRAKSGRQDEAEAPATRLGKKKKASK